MTVLAIRQYWLQEIGALDADTPALSVERFLEETDFGECWLEIMKLYPGIRRAPGDARDKQLYAIPKNACNMDYYKLRAFANFTELRSAAMFLLFSQLVGEESRAIRDGRDPTTSCMQVLHAVRRVVDRTEQYLSRSEDRSGRNFWRQYAGTRGEDGMLPNLELLRLWRDAFLNGELPPDPIRQPHVSKPSDKSE